MVMLYRALLLAILFSCLIAFAADADGLIFELPGDGTWATFTVQTDAKFRAVSNTPKGKIEIPEQKQTF